MEVVLREADAAVAVVRTGRPEAKILLMRRAEREGDSWSGHWSLPGGRREAADADLLETALREVEEECGIRLRREQMSAALPERVARRRTGPYLTVTPFVVDIEEELPTRLDPREAAEAEWVPLAVLCDPARHRLQRVPGMPDSMWFPAVEMRGAPLWGFTYRLLADWLGMSAGSAAAMPAADELVAFLRALGVPARGLWNGGGADRRRGALPVESLAEHLASSTAYAARVNGIEVGPERVRVFGLGYEEYVIVPEREGDLCYPEREPES